MDEVQLSSLLNRLIAQWEGEAVEFKNIGDGYSTSDIGKYVTALANEANLRNLERAWLVFGVDNKTRSVVGSSYRADPERLNGLKHSIAQGTEPSMTVREIHQLDADGKRVLLFEIPPAPRGMPLAWNGHYYARAGESLTALGLDKQDEIRGQVSGSDWSAVVVPGADLEDLDPDAVRHARDAFAKKHANRFDPKEVADWPAGTFLDRARVTIDGAITRTALLLLGRAEAAHHLSPHPAQLTWRLEGDEKAYQHFGPPFLLTTTEVYRKIRNVQIRILPGDTLLPVEVSKYDQTVVLEAMHNCIAHQDYGLGGRVVVTEFGDRLVFENVGDFFEGQPTDYVPGSKTPLRYRNPFLVQAMTALNMIDTMGYGISRMYRGQAKRYFPLPDYDFSQSGLVRMTIHGRVLDPAYSRLLIERTDLPLEDVCALDRVQKRLPVDEPVIRRLRRAGLIEGRKPNLHVSASVAQVAATKADYIRTRGQDDQFYKKLVLDYLQKFEPATRSEIDKLLLDKLSDALNDDQKADKISNLLSAMRRSGLIQNTGSRGHPQWVLAETMQKETGGGAE
jgi:ATP-dependent DNA helicase RecG